MITYKDIQDGHYDTLDMDYNDEMQDGAGLYFGDPRPIKDTRLLDDVSVASLGFSIADVKKQLAGLELSLIDPATDKPYPNTLYDSAIEYAISWAEQTLDISIRPRVCHELDDYNKTDYMNYMFVHTNTKPIIQIDDSRLIFNNASVIKYPRDWIKVNHRFGIFRMQPTALMASTSGGILQSPTLIYPSMSPNTGMPYGNSNFAPGMCGTTYVAGMLPRDPRDKDIQRPYYVPGTLKALVNKLAAVYVLEIWGRTVLQPGISGYGVHIDGIGSNIVSTQSAENTGSSADIKLLMTDIQNNLKALRAYYGYNFGVIC